MPHPRRVIAVAALLLALALVACGRPAPGGMHSDSCPAPAPTDRTSCTLAAELTCDYSVPGDCAGVVRCRCTGASWHCRAITCGPCGAAAPNGPLAVFCSGGEPRAVVGGQPTDVVDVSAERLGLPGRDDGVFRFAVASNDAVVFIDWSAERGETTLPATVDLANLPSGWTVRVGGCDPRIGSCGTRYTTCLSGALQVARDADGEGYVMTLCVDVAAWADSDGDSRYLPLQLYARNVRTREPPP